MNLKDLNSLQSTSYTNHVITIYLLFLIWCCSIQGQQKAVDNFPPAMHLFEHGQQPREVLNIHLNKSHFFQGETLGFAVYATYVNSQMTSRITRNIYCILENKEGETMKQRMILGFGGHANGSFLIDESIPAGHYTLKVFTNYQRNFSQNLAAVKPFVVLGNTEDLEHEVDQWDLQILPEGGHAVAGINNNYGFIIKNQYGQGLADAVVSITDSTGNTVASLQTDRFGLASTSVLQQSDERWVVQVATTEDTLRKDLPKPEALGITIKLISQNNRLAVRLSTNDASLPMYQDKRMQLTFHNGTEMRMVPFSFQNDLEVIKFISAEALFPGMNVFTVFNHQNQPILERLYFNFNDLKIFTDVKARAISQSDTVTINIEELPFKGLNAALSISTLPLQTKAYQHQENIISKFYLSPYLKGPVQNPGWYFKGFDSERKKALDNLLLTQGWSSYDWSDIFSEFDPLKFQSENGIDVTVNVYQPKKKYDYIVHETAYNQTEKISPETAETFTIKSRFPLQGEEIGLSRLTSGGGLRSPNVYLQFQPASFPSWEPQTSFSSLSLNEPTDYAMINPIIQSSWTDSEQVNEVMYTVSDRDRRLDVIDKISQGMVDVFDAERQNQFTSLENYLNLKGYALMFFYGEYLLVEKGRWESVPILVLNEEELWNADILKELPLGSIDYVYSEPANYTGPQDRWQQGFIQIQTDPTTQLPQTFSHNIYRAAYPLTFSRPTSFYVPAYGFYEISSFHSYGVIDWQGQALPDEQGVIRYTFPDVGVDKVVLHIEGLAQDGTVVFSELALDIEGD